MEFNRIKEANQKLKANIAYTGKSNNKLALKIEKQIQTEDKTYEKNKTRKKKVKRKKSLIHFHTKKRPKKDPIKEIDPDKSESKLTVI